MKKTSVSAMMALAVSLALLSTPARAEEAPKPADLSWISWTGMGVGIVGAGVSGYVIADAQTGYRNAMQGPSSNRTPEHLEALDRELWLGVTGLAISSALTIGSTMSLLVTTKPTHHASLNTPLGNFALTRIDWTGRGVAFTGTW